MLAPYLVSLKVCVLESLGRTLYGVDGLNFAGIGFVEDIILQLEDAISDKKFDLELSEI